MSSSEEDVEDAVYCVCCGEPQHPDWANDHKVCENCVDVAIAVIERTPEGKEEIAMREANGTLDEYLLNFCMLNADNYDWIQEYRDMA